MTLKKRQNEKAYNCSHAIVREDQFAALEVVIQIEQGTENEQLTTNHVRSF